MTPEEIFLIGHFEKTVELMGHKFTLRSLTYKEEMDVVRRAERGGVFYFDYASKIYALAYSLQAIDGEQYYATPLKDTPEALLEEKIKALEQMSPILIEALWEKYKEIVEEESKAIEELKKK